MGGLSGYADLASERGEFRRSPDFEVGSRLGIDGTKSILGGTPRSPHNGNPKSGITTKGTKDTKRMRGGRFLVSATTPWDRDAFDGPSFVVFVPFVVPYPGIWDTASRPGAHPTCGWVRHFPHPSGDPEEKQTDSDDPTGSQRVAGGGVVPDATSGTRQG